MNESSSERDKRNKPQVLCLAHFSNRQIKLTELHLGEEYDQLILTAKKNTQSVNPIQRVNKNQETYFQTPEN